MHSVLFDFGPPADEQTVTDVHNSTDAYEEAATGNQSWVKLVPDETQR